MKDKNKKDFGCVKSFPQCIQWNLGDIEVLDIKNGDYLDEIIFAIACKIKEVTEPLDLSTVSIQCILDKFDAVEPATKTIQTILKLIIENECKLKDLIDALQDQINGDSPALILNLRCLAEEDAYGNTLPYNEQTVLQSLINEVCSLKDSVSYLNSKAIDLQNQIDAIVPYTEPNVTSCLYTSRPLSQAVGIISNNFCDFTTKIGTTNQIDTAIGKQCSSLNALFSGDPNFIQIPVTLAESNNNQWMAICNILNRVAAIEATCCAPSCDKIKLGFIYSYDYESRELTLSFTSGSGTFIPTGFVDCGSEFTIKNCTGDIIVTSLQPIENNADLIFILPSGVCIDTLTISIKTKFCLSDSNNQVIITCRDCFTKTINIQGECCTLTNPNEENVLLTYSTVVITET
jgi:hypothetical protein